MRIVSSDIGSNSYLLMKEIEKSYKDGAFFENWMDGDDFAFDNGRDDQEKIKYAIKWILDVYELKKDKEEYVKKTFMDWYNKKVTEVTKGKIKENIDVEDTFDEYNAYNAKHAAEWVERYPYGWYNSESDKGIGDEDDEDLLVNVEEDIS